MTAPAAWAARVLTIHPEMFPGPLGHALAGKALADGVWSLDTIDIRQFAADKHRTVDDTPFGGGYGMVMKPDVLGHAIQPLPLLGGEGVVGAPCPQPGLVALV